MLTEKTPLCELKGIGDARNRAFLKLGIENAGDLLAFFPRDYEDRGHTVSIKEAPDGEICSLIIKIVSTSEPYRTKTGLTITRSEVSDDTGSMELVFFNNPYIQKTLTRGKVFRVYGRIRYTMFGKEMTAPKTELVYKGRILKPFFPIYRLSPPLTQKIVQDSVKQVLPLCDSLENVLPDSIIKENHLINKKDAVKELHDPQSEDRLRIARRTLAFEELLTFQIALSGIKSIQKTEKAHPFSLKGAGMGKFYNSLPFELTNAQKRVTKEIIADLGRDIPMARLVQGDVGSGKTIIAAGAMFLCVKNGFQACMMAPTEILARQHTETLKKLFSPFGIRVELLVSSLKAKEKREIRQGLADGSIDVAVGTHALITDDTKFDRLALAVTDEQHRFGVAQRAKLLDKSEKDSIRAHMLVMSATPIPRSLSLIIYGDLDVSVLDELPPGRREIKTRMIREDKLPEIYAEIKEEIKNGGQAYIVCPLIEENESLGRTAAETHFEYLSEKVFKGTDIGLIHGKMKTDEKEKAMADFAGGKTKVLVSTTVIEVGVDVKNASYMVIENAECFGLSQLHQLRGRIGRGTRQSHCILVNGSGSQEAFDRLKIMVDTKDGFKIAEKDLENRGPGDFFGERQSGEFKFACAAVSDMPLIEKTKKEAKKILNDYENPEYKKITESALKFLERTDGLKTVN